ncbi:hypothetical protein L21SP2_2196 [Salinispira pacifica]|uniref:Uncharacterized protein n=1 Tax=Salinispira pacifica TaxID=1307761 RepID=V5WJ45_9SPIO|nr:hypothetical protein L21SP2_2196 [Salinispira pacifica]
MKSAFPGMVRLLFPALLFPALLFPALIFPAGQTFVYFREIGKLSVLIGMSFKGILFLGGYRRKGK